MIPAGSGTAEVVVQETSGAGSAEVVITTNVLTADESGKTFFLALAGGFVTTLPAPAIGLNYKFFVQIAPTGDYTIVTAAAAQILAGQVYESSGGNGDSETAFTATTITFVAAAGAGKIGDSAEVYSDGTNWYARCYCDTAAGITIDG